MRLRRVAFGVAVGDVTGERVVAGDGQGAVAATDHHRGAGRTGDVLTGNRHGRHARFGAHIRIACDGIRARLFNAVVGRGRRSVFVIDGDHRYAIGRTVDGDGHRLGARIPIGIGHRVAEGVGQCLGIIQRLNRAVGGIQHVGVNTVGIDAERTVAARHVVLHADRVGIGAGGHAHRTRDAGIVFAQAVALRLCHRNRVGDLDIQARTVCIRVALNIGHDHREGFDNISRTVICARAAWIVIVSDYATRRIVVGHGQGAVRARHRHVTAARVVQLGQGDGATTDAYALEAVRRVYRESRSCHGAVFDNADIAAARPAAIVRDVHCRHIINGSYFNIQSRAAASVSGIGHLRHIAVPVCLWTEGVSAVTVQL